MKLILMRHAKSDWHDPLQDDHDRPLNRRGRESAPKIGRWLRDMGHTPDLILCSTAKRTRETRALLGFDDTPTVDLDALYLADANMILAQATGAGAQTVMVVGHNPGMAEAASLAVATPPVHPDFHRYPTAACTVIDAPGPLPGRALAFLVPRDL
ncbi:histidine phosphatase family protein [Jannaschia sp. M317]|uniref:SixA phosphatase family protein n=1 Tax=Jannaschia sp. M317 TaxID=2867011 RepID=UPI0021A50499|nr:histidine phosphatase family protein [Jannaschia sp. M317]UWQ16285.1 histidine phosphatase family protein [Jannaschia sp. M317]